MSIKACSQIYNYMFNYENINVLPRKTVFGNTATITAISQSYFKYDNAPEWALYTLREEKSPKPNKKRILHEWSFHMKFMKQACGEFP